MTSESTEIPGQQTIEEVTPEPAPESTPAEVPAEAEVSPPAETASPAVTESPENVPAGITALSTVPGDDSPAEHRFRIIHQMHTGGSDTPASTYTSEELDAVCAIRWLTAHIKDLPALIADLTVLL
jgi:hypothetical protein